MRVLFVGNSYTSANGLPGVVESILDATTAVGASAEAVTVDGAFLADHWNTTIARERVSSGEFDAVVLQGNSLDAVNDVASFQEYATLFAGAMAKAGERGVWFATWARRDVESPPETLWRQIDDQYQIAAAHNGDVVARVGAAFEIALLTMPDVALLAADRSHPTAAGTLLAGCVIARALSTEPPRLPYPVPLGVDRDIARKLCAIAENGVPCGPEESLCDGKCVPWDTRSCGGCGLSCAPGDPCRHGVCGCGEGYTGCDGRCESLTSLQNCGGCGNVCGFGQVCGKGGCACTTSTPIPSRTDSRLAGGALYPKLTALEPGCVLPADEATEACARAAHRFCVGTGCFTSGFGPPIGHAPAVSAVMCLQGTVLDISFTTSLAILAPDCDGIRARDGQLCVTAVHRFCVNNGFVSGYGPVDSTGDEAKVTCLTDATVMRVSSDELRSHASRCTPEAGTCSVAAWNMCESLGHAGGFGPVELSGDESDIVCVD